MHDMLLEEEKHHRHTTTQSKAERGEPHNETHSTKQNENDNDDKDEATQAQHRHQATQSRIVINEAPWVSCTVLAHITGNWGRSS